ncbi:dihydroxyacetone kinase [Mangrovibacter sp. MFB070]|uniref:type 1 glutamine amidotransferase domain-containing protein n=1 Tax=Mangrovibacter sp. MFB070 TaxID=1224318 RepID=UPI0004D94B1C|nr:type 1 glutamine amidotransferase domain-containing protein [Mangrovibacter sp. MFB070]KEA51433.1 dihydroxyacetone kinase [Mangrovibacter sp. MFB070]
MDFHQSVKPILFVLTSHRGTGDSGFYLPELTHPLHVLEQAGIPTEFASPEGGLPPVYGVELDDPVNARYWQDSAFQQKLKNTLVLSEVDRQQYSGIMYVGGHGTMWDFPTDATIISLTRDMFENNQVVAAVCHGPAALVNVQLSNGNWLVDGKRVAAFTNTEEQAVGMTQAVPFLLETALKEHGAQHEKAGDWQSQVVVDGNLITGQNPQSATGVGEAIRNQLLNKASQA